MKKIVSFIITCLLIAPLFGQGNIKTGFSTPRQTVYTHLHFLQPEQYKPEEAAKAMAVVNSKEAKKLAVQLKQILDGEGLYVYLEKIPDNPAYIDSASGKAVYVLFPSHPKIYVEKVNDKWLYSQETVNSIPEMHQRVYPLGSDVFVNLLPEFGHQSFLGLYLWQYVGIGIVIVISWLFYALLGALFGVIIKQLIKSPKVARENRMVIQKAALPASIMVLTFLLEILVPVLQLPITLSKYIILVLNVLTPIYGTITAFRLVDLLNIYLFKKADETENTLDDQLIPLVAKMLKILIIVLGILVVLHQLGVNITVLLTGLSIGGLAFALAAQDTIKNLFGSFMIFLDRPFQIGDWINFKGVDGTVETVGFRSTRVRTFANSLVYVPNGEIANMVVDNMGMRVFRRYSTKISVTYDTRPEVLEKFVQGLRNMVAKHPNTRKDYYEIHMNEMGSTSLDILFYIFFDVPDWSKELKARHEIILETMKLADTLEIRFAFPTQTLHIEEFPDKPSLTPQHELTTEQMDAKMAAFMEGYKARYQAD